MGDSAVHGPDRSLGSDTDKDWAPVSDPDPDTGRDAQVQPLYVTRRRVPSNFGDLGHQDLFGPLQLLQLVVILFRWAL